MNILITSAGSRNLIIRYFRETFQSEGRIIAADASPMAPALYEADAFYLLPRIDDPSYIDCLLEICQKERVDALLSLIDPELSLLAKHKKTFLSAGVTPLVSDYDAVELAFDKYAMYRFLSSHGFQTAKAYLNKDAFYRDLKAGIISFPVFVKPYKGSASLNIHKVYSIQEIETLFALSDDYMIQEFMDGIEIGVDAFVDPLSKKTVSVFAKEKIKMRAGETDKSRSFKDEILFDLVAQLAELIGYTYMIDIDVFRIKNNYFISEINPRFGGGYPHAYACGVNFPKLILNSLKGIENSKQFGNYADNIYMMKYNDICIQKNL